MKKVELCGKVKVETYPFRQHDFNCSIMFYNESGENIVITWDDSQQCCEDFEADVPSTLLNTEFPNGVCVEVNEQADTVTFTVTEREVETLQIFAVTIRNEHNGYYAHKVGILRNGEYSWESFV